MDKEVQKTQIKFARCDGFVDPGRDFSKSIVKEYVHKEVVRKIGEGEDEFVIDQKPVCVREYDLDKEIQVEAKKNNLKTLLAEVVRTGDESLLQQRKKEFMDLRMMPEDPIQAKKMVDSSRATLAKLPESLRGKSLEDLMKMSKEEILEAYGVKAKKEEKVVEQKFIQPKSEEVIEKKEEVK